jgi:predicted ester cyclase
VPDDRDIAAPDPLADRWEAAWSGREPFAGCCTPDLHYEDPIAVEPLSGVEALSEHAERLRRAFPDLRIERTARPIGGGGYACIPWRLLATHKGDLGALPPTGRFMILHGVHYVELSDGRIIRARGFFDLYDAAVQLGLLPPRGSLGETALLLLRGFGLRPRA